MNSVRLMLLSRTHRSQTMSWQLTRGCFALLVCWGCPCSLLWLCLLPFLGAGLHEKQTALKMAGRKSRRHKTACRWHQPSSTCQQLSERFHGTVNNMCSPIAASRGPSAHSRLGCPGEGDVAWTRLGRFLLTFSASRTWEPPVAAACSVQPQQSKPRKSSAGSRVYVFSHICSMTLGVRTSWPTAAAHSTFMQQRPGEAYTFCCVMWRDAWSLLCAPVELAYNSCAAAERCHHCSYSSSADCYVIASTD